MVGRLPRLLLCCLVLLTGVLAAAPQVAVASSARANDGDRHAAPAVTPQAVGRSAVAPWAVGLPAVAEEATAERPGYSPSWHRGTGRRNHRDSLPLAPSLHPVGSIPPVVSFISRLESTDGFVDLPPDDTARPTAAPRPPPIQN